jgi:hypothetical protein
MESNGSLPCSQEPSAGSYPKSYEYSPYHLFYFSKIHINIILTYV